MTSNQKNEWELTQICAGDRGFTSLKFAIAYLDTLPPTVHLQAQSLIAEHMQAVGEQFADKGAEYWGYLKRDDTMRELLPGEAQQRERIGYVKYIAEGIGARDRMRDEVKRGIAKNWKDVDTGFYLGYGNNAMSVERKCSARMSYVDAVARVNQAIVERLTKKGKKLPLKRASRSPHVRTIRDILPYHWPCGASLRCAMGNTASWYMGCQLLI